MRTLRRCERIAIVLLALVFGCWGCAASGPAAGKAPAGSEPAAKAPASVEGSATSPGAAAGHILNVDVQDRGKNLVIRVTADVSPADYEFKRLGESRFALELRGLSAPGEDATLPNTSPRVQLVYANIPTGLGASLVGTLSSPIDQYMLNKVDNDLVLTLVLLPEPQLPAKTAAGAGKKGKIQVDAASKNYSAVSPAPGGKIAVRGIEGVGVPSKGAMGQPGEARNASGMPPGLGKYTGKPISFDLMDADLRNVLRLLADITGTNIVIEPDVNGKVTLKVEQVPWDQVLDMILSMNDLGKEQMGNVIRVARQQKLRQEMAVHAEQLKARQDLLEATKDFGDIRTVYLTVNYASPDEIAAKINDNRSERGRISVDARSSLIIYTDYPARIDLARNLLARLDRPTPQVLIEARIVTMKTSSERNVGVQWALSTSSDHFSQDFSINHPASVSPTDYYQFSVGQLTGSVWSLDFKLAAMETAEELKIVAAPKVLTLNNVKAKVSQGTQIPYLVASTATPAAGAVSSTEFKDATIELAVVPHITPDHKVRLEIDAKQDEPGVVINSQTSIDTRKIQTELLVDDGNIVVIGGVIRDRSDFSTTATPGLSKIPVLGWLFKSEDKIGEKTELLIFISPKIIEPSGPPNYK